MTRSTHRLFPLVPAAGKSRRMGHPKLLLTLNGETLIRRLVGQLMSQLSMLDVLPIPHVLVRKDDQPLQQELRDLPATVVLSDETPDMKASVQLLLDAVQAKHHPHPEEGWVLIPADHPVVEVPVLERLLTAWDSHPTAIIVPVHEGQRGHPTILPWSITQRFDEIPTGQGVNWLIRHAGIPVIEVDGPEPSVLWDIDTPDDFARLRRWLNAS